MTTYRLNIVRLNLRSSSSRSSGRSLETEARSTGSWRSQVPSGETSIKKVDCMWVLGVAQLTTSLVWSGAISVKALDMPTQNVEKRTLFALGALKRGMQPKNVRQKHHVCSNCRFAKIDHYYPVDSKECPRYKNAFSKAAESLDIFDGNTPAANSTIPSGSKEDQKSHMVERKPGGN